jgi:hypothetical protein
MLQLCLNNNDTRYNFINVYNVYNLFLNNYNKIIDKSNLLTIKLILRMQDKSVIIKKKFALFFISEFILF